jgi:hypothetical protein
MAAPAIGFGTVTTTALAEYFIKRYNLIGRDAQYMKNRPTLAAIPRDTKELTKSDGFYQTLKVGKGFSASPDWVEGNKNHTPSKAVRWHVEYPFAQYGFVAFDNLALKRNNLGTLMDIKGAEADDVREGMLDTCEYELWNDGTGARGQIDVLAGSEAARVVTLKNPSDVYNFEYGQVVYGSTTATGAGTDHADRYTVTDLDPQNGKLGLTQLTTTGGQELADEDYLFIVGSKDAYMPGIPTFIPATAPADTLYGVTRTANPATSGWRFPFVASISETISRSFSYMGRWVDKTAKKFVVVLSTADWLMLSMERESKVVPDPTAVQKWGLEGLLVRTTYGTITCVAIPMLADGRGYILDYTTWKLYTLGNVPHVIDEDGQTFVRGGVDTADGYKNGDFIKMQLRMWKVLLCLKPMANATFATEPS